MLSNFKAWRPCQALKMPFRVTSWTRRKWTHNESDKIKRASAQHQGSHLGRSKMQNPSEIRSDPESTPDFSRFLATIIPSHLIPLSMQIVIIGCPYSKFMITA